MGRPPARKPSQGIQKCQSCTTRLKTGTAIYHAGPVGKHCEKAKEKTQAKRKVTPEVTDSPISTRSRSKSRTDHSTSESPKGGSPTAMRQEIDELRKQVNALSKVQPKPAKRKRDLSPVIVQSEDEDDSESESEESPVSSPDPSSPKRQKRPEERRGRPSRSNAEKTRRRREHAPSRRHRDYSDDEEEDLPSPGKMTKGYITPGLLAALPGLASTSAAKSKSGEHRTAADRAPLPLRIAL